MKSFSGRKWKICDSVAKPARGVVEGILLTGGPSELTLFILGWFWLLDPQGRRWRKKLVWTLMVSYWRGCSGEGVRGSRIWVISRILRAGGSGWGFGSGGR